MKKIKRSEKNDGNSKNSGMNGRTPLADAVDGYGKENRVSFHVPGHKGSAFASGFRSVFNHDLLRYDLTELPGLDDYHHPVSVIADAQECAAQLFGAEETFFLTNGTTSGLIAAIAAVSSEENTVIMERNSHECTTRGLILSGASPYYVYNDFDENTGLPTGISCEQVNNAIRNCPSPAAIVLTHPSYYGTYSDLQAIVDTAHQAGVVVIVDEAHGAQLSFTKQRGIPSALSTGADIVVQSTHKMLGSLTQSSMLHVQGSLVDRNRLRFYISFMHSTSPSYLLMTSLDLIRACMGEHGNDIWETIIRAVRDTRARLNRLSGVSCPRFFKGCDGEEHELEAARLLISAWNHGLTGIELSRILASQYQMDVEFSGLQYAVILLGAGSTEEDLNRLFDALEQIIEKPSKVMDAVTEQQLSLFHEAGTLRPDRGMTPRQAVGARLLELSGEHAEGMVSARDISLYPPGVPVIRTGEMISREIVEFVEAARRCGMKFHGTVEVESELRFLCAEDPRILDMMNGFF